MWMGVASRLVTYEQWITEVVKVVETVGTGHHGHRRAGRVPRVSARRSHRDGRRAGSYERLRRNLGRCILLGLEVLIVADIVRTVVVDQMFQSVTVLGIIVLIRILLSFSLDVEIDGVWPWNRLRESRNDQSLVALSRRRVVGLSRVLFSRRKNRACRPRCHDGTQALGRCVRS